MLWQASELQAVEQQLPRPVAGLGIGCTQPPLASTAIAVVPPAQAGMASGINNTFRQVGIATGIAAFGAIFSSRVDGKLADLLTGTSAGSHGLTVEELSSGGSEVLKSVPAGQRGVFHEALDRAFVFGMDEIFLVGAILALLAAVCAFVMVKQRELLYLQEEPAVGAAA